MASGWQNVERNFNEINASISSWKSGTRDDATKKLGLYAKILAQKGFLSSKVSERLYAAREESKYKLADLLELSRAARDWMRDAKERLFKFTAQNSKVTLARPQ